MMMMITECLRTIGQKYTLWPKICRHLTMTPMCGPFPSKTSPTYDCLDRLCLWLSFFHHDDVPEHKARSVKTWFGKAHGKPTVCNSILMPCVWSGVLSKHILYGVGRCPNTLDHVVCVCVHVYSLYFKFKADVSSVEGLWCQTKVVQWAASVKENPLWIDVSFIATN